MALKNRFGFSPKRWDDFFNLWFIFVTVKTSNLRERHRDQSDFYGHLSGIVYFPKKACKTRTSGSGLPTMPCCLYKYFVELLLRGNFYKEVFGTVLLLCWTTFDANGILLQISVSVHGWWRSVLSFCWIRIALIVSKHPKIRFSLKPECWTPGKGRRMQAIFHKTPWLFLLYVTDLVFKVTITPGSEPLWICRVVLLKIPWHCGGLLLDGREAGLFCFDMQSDAKDESSLENILRRARRLSAMHTEAIRTMWSVQRFRESDTNQSLYGVYKRMIYGSLTFPINLSHQKP